MKDNFIEELRELCKKYDVRLDSDGYEGIFVDDGYKDEFINDIYDARKNLTQPEK